ncbi:helix-turn-helix domain-containing protein [Streptomyces armeniacus]|uniref:Helix-turn-helix domain-containing protein n=1 Tax=Streptomyces armeniacus TaxID=83291 RepID=A0A345XPL0_9ACTN|nr:helix-turn-helix domain-containing protein [Streptomyces armeniacus]AXK33576.1 helix-turn-helix domain-containing protein [Streptomyces armeniacus]
MSAAHLPDPAADDPPAPPPGLLVTGCYDEPPGYAVRRSGGARNLLLTWTLAGGGRFRQGAADVAARPGDLVVIGPGVPHDYAVAPGCDRWAFWWVHCQPRIAWRSWLGPYESADRLYAITSVPGDVRERIDAAFRRVHADARWAGAGAPPEPEAAGGAGTRFRAVAAQAAAARELALGGVEEVLVLAAAAAAPARERDQGARDQGVRADRSARAPDDVDPRVRRAEALLLADPAAPHSVASLAERVALSPSRLAHLFSAQLGHTPMEAVRDARLRHAARLLEMTDLPVERVAAASGFSGPSHFSRLFRARFGAPPGAFRAGFRR